MFSEVSADDFDPELLFKSATIRLRSFLFSREETLLVTLSLSQYHPADTLAQKPLLHFGENKFRERKQTREGERTEEEKDGESADEEHRGGGRAQFTEAALNQPITVKENISWCVSSPLEEERMKGEEGKCI